MSCVAIQMVYILTGDARFPPVPPCPHCADNPSLPVPSLSCNLAPYLLATGAKPLQAVHLPFIGKVSSRLREP